MRVLFNTYPVAFDCPGGGEVLLCKYKEALERSGVEVLLYDPWTPQLDAVDVVHFFSVQGGSAHFCGYVKDKGLPLLISPILWLTKENAARMPMNEIRRLLHLCDRVLPNSKAELTQLNEAFDLRSDKFTITPCGIDQSFTQPASTGLFTTRFGLKKPFILNVANLEPRKNQHRLIRAMKGLGLDLIILGNIRDQAYAEECLKEGDGFVRHLGYLEHGSEMLNAAYQECELFVLPSLLETPGLAALEAGALGAKVVVTHEGSPREYFAEFATYVDPLDERDIRRGIETELQSVRDGQLRERITYGFTWDRAAKSLISAYELALASNHLKVGGERAHRSLPQRRHALSPRRTAPRPADPLQGVRASA